MSLESMAVYKSHLDWQLGEDSPLTVTAIYDPSGENEQPLYGIFDEVAYHSTGADPQGTMRKNKYSLFTIAQSPAFDINDDKKILIDMQLYIISFRDYDKTGAQRLWLRLNLN
jgi:hypothetical protein